jgi:hypothetical protein
VTSGVAVTLRDWRARLEADGGGLENRYECKLIKGSNPLPSATAVSESRSRRRHRFGER